MLRQVKQLLQNPMIKLLTVADGITILNATFGFLAILFMFTNELRIAFSLILLGLLADGLDGLAARRYKKGKIGEHLEPMADLTSLAVAPMVFVFVSYQQNAGQYLFILTGAIVLFFLCSIIRLGSFHVMKDDKYFVGLPVSASAIVILVTAFLYFNIIVCMILMLILSIAMVSPLRFPKPKTTINAVATILIFGAIVLGDFSVIVPLMLFVAMICYGIGGPLYLRASAKK